MNRLSSSSKGTCLLSLSIILPSFIKIGQELFEIIEVNTQTQTHRHTRMKIIPIQKQSFGPGNESSSSNTRVIQESKSSFKNKMAIEMQAHLQTIKHCIIKFGIFQQSSHIVFTSGGKMVIKQAQYE